MLSEPIVSKQNPWYRWHDNLCKKDTMDFWILWNLNNLKTEIKNSTKTFKQNIAIVVSICLMKMQWTILEI